MWTSCGSLALVSSDGLIGLFAVMSSGSRCVCELWFVADGSETAYEGVQLAVLKWRDFLWARCGFLAFVSCDGLSCLFAVM